MTMNLPHSGISPWRQFIWLLKREYWEHRGGFFWAQVITGLIIGAFSLLGAIASVARLQHGVTAMGDSGQIGESDDLYHTLIRTGDSLMLGGMLTAAVVVAFVVFFYALGSLYDDRRDRSMLFWKSLPVSDTQTVLSKVVWAVLLAPLVSILVALTIGLILWWISIVIALLGGISNPGAIAMHIQAHPFAILWVGLKSLPIRVLWSLPTVGWLMFCSVWANSKPFLWAVLFPLLTCVMLNILNTMPGIRLPINEICYAFYRLVLSVMPFGWLMTTSNRNVYNSHIEDSSNVTQWLLQKIDLNIYSDPDIWIGGAAGILLIIGAIYLRRQRSDI